MNVLFWTDGFWPRIGGIETQAAQFVSSMQQRGHRYLVVAQKDCQESPEEEVWNGIPVKRLNFNDVINGPRVAELNTIKIRLEYILAVFKPDLIHLNTAIGNSAYVFLLFKNLFAIPIVLNLHSICLDGGINFVTKKILSGASAICCVSQFVRQQVEKHFPEEAGKSVCIYNGLEFPGLLPSPLDFQNPFLLCLGRLSREKGFDQAIEAMAAITGEFPNCRLIIAGDGSERAALVNLANECQLKDKVSFVGALEFADVPNMINQASIVLMPSKLESFGLVALEAAQMQRPVIASSVGGLPEVVIDNETGLLVPPADVTALVQAIKLLMNNAGLAITLGKNARQRALTTFTIHSVIADYEEVYKRELRK